MAFTQVLLFVGTIAGLLSIVPLAVWFATGSGVQAWRALKSYSLIMGCLIGGGFALGAVIFVIEILTQ